MEANAATVMPSHLPMVRLSIERIGERLVVLAQAVRTTGERLTGRSKDFKVLVPYVACHAHVPVEMLRLFSGVFCRDERMQMGGVASAHFRQRTSKLTTAILNQEIESRTEQHVTKGDLCPAGVEWMQQRTQQLGPSQAVLELGQIFQDNFLESAVGDSMERIVENVDAKLVKGKLKLHCSPDPEATRPFSCSFETIGAVSRSQSYRRYGHSQKITSCGACATS